ncbi:head-to-tail connector complex protein [Synechococcus phage Ssp-JY38]|nr:gene transfer agent protein [Synechococcus phage Yong-L2-223]
MTVVLHKAGQQPSAQPELEARKFDADLILPIQLIRQHTKTDDVPHVTDELLRTYRRSALEAASQYTGLLLTEQRVIKQDASSKHNALRARRRGYYTVDLEFPTVDGLVYMYGGKSEATPSVRTIKVAPGATQVRVPVDHYYIDMQPCCGDPCNWKDPCNAGVTLMYRAGLGCEQDIPACIVMGALKYIAWTIENPGDYVDSAMRTLPGMNTETGPNNAAWMSGAIEEWRLCVRDV